MHHYKVITYCGHIGPTCRNQAGNSKEQLPSRRPTRKQRLPSVHRASYMYVSKFSYQHDQPGHIKAFILVREREGGREGGRGGRSDRERERERERWMDKGKHGHYITRLTLGYHIHCHGTTTHIQHMTDCIVVKGRTFKPTVSLDPS